MVRDLPGLGRGMVVRGGGEGDGRQSLQTVHDSRRTGELGKHGVEKAAAGTDASPKGPLRCGWTRPYCRTEPLGRVTCGAQADGRRAAGERATVHATRTETARLEFERALSASVEKLTALNRLRGLGCTAQHAGLRQVGAIAWAGGATHAREMTRRRRPRKSRNGVFDCIAAHSRPTQTSRYEPAFPARLLLSTAVRTRHRCTRRSCLRR